MGQRVVKTPPLGHGHSKKTSKKTTSGCEGGGGGGRRVETLKNITSGSRLDAREVVVGDVSKRRKKPPPARVWMQGRWWW